MAGRTIAVLSPGEMGSQVGRLLSEAGNDVVTMTAGRSERSRHRAEEAGLRDLPSLDAIARSAELIICVVPSLSAEPQARAVAAAVVKAGTHPAYLDLNSIGPETARRIGAAVEAAGGRFVDGSITGNASALPSRATVYLSGQGAADLAEWIDPPLRTEIVGPEPGQASAFKVLYAGLTKGIAALGVELLAGAERLGLYELLLQKHGEGLPSVIKFFRTSLPGYPERAKRRAEEMVELAEAFEELGLTANMAHAAQVTLEQLAARYRQNSDFDDDDLDSMVRWLASRPVNAT
jgi:3-hydroxyisobutyrate dehydrogenase-like beta-hydroxyacid dehydrogenase